MSDIDMSENDDEYQMEYTSESDSEPDVDLENQYYNAKSLKESGDIDESLAAFDRVLELEEEKGEWGFKALKQKTKVNFKHKRHGAMLESYKTLLGYIKSSVTRNYSERSINSILDNISASKNMKLLKEFYGLTLESLKIAKNDRLWFKTNTKLASLYLQNHDWNSLLVILKQLRSSCQTESGEEDLKKGTQLLEIIQIDIQMSTLRKDNKRLKFLYEKSKSIKTGIPHPLTKGIIHECGGKMHLSEENFAAAHTDFFEAFKCFDEAGSPRRISCLKYLVLANMLSSSDINPFDSQEAKPYKNYEAISAMTALRDAYHVHDIEGFQSIVANPKSHDAIMGDQFIREHIESLLKLIRTQKLMKIIVPYKRIKMSRLAEELKVNLDEIEKLLVNCIAEELIDAKIDQKNLLVIMDDKEPDPETSRNTGFANWGENMAEINRHVEYFQRFPMRKTLTS
ncbi:unnamed protein product [Oikopleura dioica]|uniref:PCI domain-containing protein n=1 Tax=Oikopleura dioica TaxID=34765 RepID=E4XNT4_OIKDI|nr:unnamed protein product [Oikopleura dioica]